jgi:hypothetical protein
LPLGETAVVRGENDLPQETRDRLRRDGVLVNGSTEAKSIGALYTELRERGVPQVVTLDALFALVHHGLVRALARVEEIDLAPNVETFVEKLAVKLATEEENALPNLGEGYRIARAVVGVARALAGGPIEDPLVRDEAALVAAHAGIATSPVLGVRIDYGRFAPPPQAARPATYRALAWLAAAPLVLVGRGEAPRAPVNVGQARANTRAALVLARACDRSVDADLHAHYTHIAHLLSFVWGPPDDVALADVDDIGDPVGIDLQKPETIANVVAVDRLRARALATRAQAVYDGAGVADRAGLSVRIFGAHAPGDSVVIARSNGMPSTLDVAAWIGAQEARAIGSHGEDSASRDDITLHASVHGSLMDALVAWADTPTFQSTAADRRKLESILSAWTLVRHTGEALARPRPSKPAELERIPTSNTNVFVEPAPAVIARLAATTRQLRRGLETLGGLDGGFRNVLVEIEDILRIAQKPDDLELPGLPERIARLEQGEDVSPVVANLYSDPIRRRHLATATGAVEPVLMLVRSGDEIILATGAHVAHHEIVSDTRLTDATWRARLKDAKRADWVDTFRTR